MSNKSVATALAAAALTIGHASAFTSPAAMQRATMQRSAVCSAPGFRRGLPLRAVQSADVARLVEAGMAAETAEKVLGEGKTVNEVRRPCSVCVICLLRTFFLRIACILTKSFVSTPGDGVDADAH